MRLAGLCLAALLCPVVLKAEPDQVGQQDRWVAQHDSRSGSTLHYRSGSTKDLIRFDCVGPSLAMPLMDMKRPFNRILSIRSDHAYDWVAGREVFAMVLGMDGWRRVDVMALQDHLIIGPKETERGVIAMQLTGKLKVKIYANAQAGVVEQNIEITNTGMSAAEEEQMNGCRRHFSR